MDMLVEREPSLSRSPSRAPSRSLEHVLAYWQRRLPQSDVVPPLQCAWRARSERSFVRLPQLDGFEAWLVGWPPGTLAPLHDHGSAAGSAAVLCGELHETQWLALAGTWRERRWRPGQQMRLARGVCHEVRNEGDVIALSVHVYAPRLEHMTFYERSSHGGVQPVRVELAEQW